MSYFNYKEFYQNALIPMRDYDKENFCGNYCKDCSNCIKANHWLIAIEGTQKDIDHDQINWKVSVYPAKEDGVFWHLDSPFFRNNQTANLDEAIEVSKTIKNQLLNEVLTAESMLA